MLVTDAPSGIGSLTGAGVVFGVITLVWFLPIIHATAARWKKLTISLFWVAFSTLSYFLMAILNPIVGLGELVGVMVIATAFHFFFHKRRPILWVILCISAALLPWVNVIFLDWSPYPIWQGVITMLLGYASTRNEPQKQTAILR